MPIIERSRFGAFALIAALTAALTAAPIAALTLFGAGFGAGNPFAALPKPAPGQLARESAQRTPPAREPGAARSELAVPAILPGQALEIVVKFKDDAKVKDILDAFWKNAPDAKSRFEAFTKGRPELAELELDRVTYSNELVLVRHGKDGPSNDLKAARAAARAAAARLATCPDIAYAEVNATARIGAHR